MYFSRQKYLFLLVFLAAQWLSPQLARAQETISQTDTLSLSTDSIAPSPQKKEKKSSIDFPISYKANDSIVLSGSGNAYLYGEGNVNYEAIELQADYIKVDMDSSTVYAIGRENEDGEIIGPPDFKDGDDVYKSKSIRYNINTKKGFIKQALVQQGEGFIIGEETKKVENEIVCMKNGKYTTCDNHEHPHFYLNLTKAKVKQKRWVVTGPAYLVLLDVPLPLAIPFGYFPFTKQYSSGVIMPTYGTELTRGFYIANGGYYFALSDYADLALTGDIYSMGSWALYANSSYVKKYSFNGSLNMNYRVDVIGEKDLPDYSRTKNLSINWRHAQDQKASPNSTLSASVNFSSSGYDRANINNYANPTLLSQNTKSSSVSWGYRFPDSPFSLSTNILANQRTSDSTITLTLPDITFTMSRVYPLKRKNAIGKDRWYEKISMSYNGQFSNSINEIKEDQLMQSSFINDWRNGFNHTIPMNMTFNVLKYISISPNINYHERWYMKSIDESYNQTTQEVEKDTTNGFYRVYDFNVGVNASTKIYGFFTPWRKLFGDKIDRIRHVMTPTIGYSYKPDFGDPYWNYYKTYEKPTSETNSTLIEETYSPFENELYGVPSVGEQGNITFSLNNNIEMKIRQDSDSAETQYKTLSLIDAFSVNGSYNLAADSMNWSNFNANLRLKLFKGLNISLGGAFETYLYALNESDDPVRINTPRWEVGKMPRLISTGSSFGYTFNNKTFKKDKKTENKPSDTVNKTDSIEAAETKANEIDDNAGYEAFKLPWSLSFDYSVQYGKSDFNKNILEYDRELSHNMSLRGNISLTSKWKINFGGAYDITNKTITYTNLGITRDLHCWSMSANIVPFGLYKTYNFLIQVKSTLLSDMKYDKRKDYTTPIDWY